MLHEHLIARTAPLAAEANVVRWGHIRVTVLTERLFRIERDEAGLFCDEATLRVWFRDTAPVTFETTCGEDDITIRTAQAALYVHRDPSRCRAEADGVWVPLDNQGNFRSTFRTLDCCNGPMLQEKDGTQQPIRLEDGIASASGVAVLDDTGVSVLTAEGMVKKRRPQEQDIYVFVHGKDFRGALRDYYRICGPVPKLPRYAMGNWWSRYHAYTEDSYLSLMDDLAEQDIPLTVATVDMDWHWSTTLDQRKGITAAGKNDEYHGGANGWTGYSWNTDLFPDYKRFLRQLHARGLAVTLNLHPATGVRWFEDMYPQMAKAMGMDPATEAKVRVDFTSDTFINAYFDVLHKPYEKDGVDFWWIDWQQGPRAKAAGIDIMWVLNHYHAMDNRMGKDGMILSRFAETGGHRYPLGFSGDTYMTWETLRYLPYFTANAANIGFTWWSHDIGGHMHGCKDNALYTRSVQFGVFSPINRLHSSNEPYCTKEPAAYPNGAGQIAAEFMRLRHRMIPFLHSASLKNHTLGEALVEPMYYEAPHCPEAYECPNQYMFGGQLLVAPIVEKGDEKQLNRVRVWLPEGEWTDIFTGHRYTGGKWTYMVRQLDTIPVLARAGGFFVLDDRRHTNAIDCPEALEVQCFNGTGRYELWEEWNHRSVKTVFSAEGSAGTQTVTIRTEGDAEALPRRKFRLRFRNIYKGDAAVTVDGQPVEAQIRRTGGLTVTVELAPGAACTVVVTDNTDSDTLRLEQLMYALTRVECSHELKNVIWRYRMEPEELQTKIQFLSELTDKEKTFLLEGWS